MNNKPVIITFLFLFGIFLILYMTQATGYYEYKTSQKTNLTTDAIEKFEEDIKNGKNIDINDYKVKEVDNSNKISNATLKVSKTLEKGVSKVIKGLFKAISSVVEE